VLLAHARSHYVVPLLRIATWRNDSHSALAQPGLGNDSQSLQHRIYGCQPVTSDTCKAVAVGRLNQQGRGVLAVAQTVLVETSDTAPWGSDCDGEQQLDGAEIVAGFKLMNSESVAQRMRSNRLVDVAQQPHFPASPIDGER
jgi:hypothetical protein